jgi:hypothetical protein
VISQHIYRGRLDGGWVNRMKEDKRLGGVGSWELEVTGSDDTLR